MWVTKIIVIRVYRIEQATQTLTSNLYQLGISYIYKPQGPRQASLANTIVLH